MKNVILVLLIFLFIFFPSMATAQDEETFGTIVSLEKGEKAPFPGVLLDIEAAAKVLSDDEAEDMEEKIDCDWKLSLADADAKLTSGIIQTSLDYERKNHAQTIVMYERQMNNLEELATQVPEDEDDLSWFLIGTASGALVTTIIYGVLVSI